MATRTQFSFLVNGAQPSATGALNTLDVDDRVASSVTVQLAGTFALTITWQGSVDGVNWSTITAVDLSSTSSAQSQTAAAAGLYRIDTTGLTKIRPNVTAWTSSASLVCMANGVQG